jgi:DNA-directed RNA polymerase specialized sigma24 family protein
MDDSRKDFEVVVNAHGPGIFRYAFWLCGDRSMAEDLVQETLLRAWRFRDGLNVQVIFGCNGLEISQALGLPRSTVNTRLFRARQKLCDLTAEKSPASSHESARQTESYADSSFSSVLLAAE